MGIEHAYQEMFNKFNEKLPRIILIVCACIFGFVILRSILPQIWKLFLGLFKGKPDEMTRLSQKILKHEIRTAKLKFLTIAHIITALLVVAFLNFIGIIPGLMLNLESKYQITILIVLGIGFFVAYGIGYFKNPSDLVDFSGMYQDYLPADYVTVTTTEYEKWDYESSWTEKGTSAYTRDQNALDNASSMILNVIMMVIQIVFILFHILWFAICSWFDIVVVLFSVISISLKRAKLQNLVEKHFYNEVKKNNNNKNIPAQNNYGGIYTKNPVLKVCNDALVNEKMKRAFLSLEKGEDDFLLVCKVLPVGVSNMFVKKLKKKLGTIVEQGYELTIYLCEDGLLLINPKNKDSFAPFSCRNQLYFLPFSLHKWDENILKKENAKNLAFIEKMQYYYLKYNVENNVTEKLILAQFGDTQGYSIRVKCEDVILDHEKQTYQINKYERV